MTQQELAEKMFVTRQAVSRWETGETMPGADMLLQLSRLFGVSVNTLLGSPRKLICQCCGMPLEDDILGRETDGTLNEDYCKWCYDEGAFLTDCTMEEMIDLCLPHMQGDEMAARTYLESVLPTLKRWKNK
ncbi:MAG TPA: helix-turn-helix domain-containing protein [Candidatus Faecivivens stercoripullorum]|uniref:Helix-turn-helix domain-containing protein n=1 Tax=Candidatus Faecivivens stercoripullorum TaxID=2840805 RepID=A0A9D1H7Q7_9FIRM|nr:helix-turn-helix domain-containing protein [Candidatus Faecivivens stercoripullorum]